MSEPLHGWKLRFTEWLRRAGAEIVPSTNPYEVVRFRARSGVHVVYENARRVCSAAGFAEECLNRFRSQLPAPDMGIVKTTGINKNDKPALRQALLDRDGRDCFYCLQPMPDHDMTLEHLVSLDKGGSNHQDNLVLAHGDCNCSANNLPLVRKIKLQEEHFTTKISQ